MCLSERYFCRGIGNLQNDVNDVGRNLMRSKFIKEYDGVNDA